MAEAPEVKVEVVKVNMDFRSEVRELLQGTVITFLTLLNSKKFLASLGAAIAIYQQTGDLRQAAISLLVYVLAQAGADWGKESV